MLEVNVAGAAVAALATFLIGGSLVLERAVR
jgi:hypothetical protein